MLYIAYSKFNNFRTSRPNKPNITCLIKKFLKIKITFLLGVSVSFEVEWIAFEGRTFFYRGIHLLPEKWEKVIASDEKYFE